MGPLCNMLCVLYIYINLSVVLLLLLLLFVFVFLLVFVCFCLFFGRVFLGGYTLKTFHLNTNNNKNGREKKNSQ